MSSKPLLLLPFRILRTTQFASALPVYQNKRRHYTFSLKMSKDMDKAGNKIERKVSTHLLASEKHVAESVKAIKAGKVIAVPTDTIYGFACDACSAMAVNKIYEIKGRNLTSPLAICVADVSDISRFANVDGLPDGLLDSLLPGPVTVVLTRGDSSILDKTLNPGLKSIGVRVPDYDFIRAVARGSGSALALTSANFSGQPSSISPKDFEHLWHHCAYVFDGGLLQSGRAGSTVVDLTKLRSFKILRSGSAREKTVQVLLSFGLEEEAL
ncbi:hypothetical protein HPP92_018599 [Vanilla planifolia]|uniref:Threonylcarbamoyl-AMP synthase n=1 Tax=Vanilla planifolia TaxID=51239 RepID=A0A835UKY3_VANPL|nr:hypothetical protein HPP92_018599 [Vanilla planifolia]